EAETVAASEGGNRRPCWLGGWWRGGSMSTEVGETSDPVQKFSRPVSDATGLPNSSSRLRRSPRVTDSRGRENFGGSRSDGEKPHLGRNVYALDSSRRTKNGGSPVARLRRTLPEVCQ